MRTRATNSLIQWAIRFGGIFILAILLSSIQQRVVRAATAKLYKVSKQVFSFGKKAAVGTAGQSAANEQGGGITTRLRGARPQLPTETPRSVKVGASAPACITPWNKIQNDAGPITKRGVSHTYHLKFEEPLFRPINHENGPPRPLPSVVLTFRKRAP